MLRRIAVGLMMTVMLVPGMAAAHEFWIDAHHWAVAPEGRIVADIRVGQDFDGPAFSYFPPRTRRFDIVMGGQVTQVTTRAGNKPALDMAAPDEGLAIAVHVTTDYSLTYSEWDKFQSFLEHKDWTELLDVHRARGLPDTGIRERYSRYGKALIAVGDGDGADREIGMTTEIVALANPYTDDLSEGLPVKVLYDGTPRGDAQVEVFAKSPEGAVTVTKYRTDADGVAILPVQPGMTYLVDAVVVRAVELAAETDPMWESLWASLTFQVPAP